MSYKKERKYRTADSLFHKCLTISENVYGSEDQEVAINLNSLAESYREQGRFEKAKQLYNRALAITENLGLENEHVATILNNLGLLYADQDLVSKADPLLKRALAIKEKIYGHENLELTLNLHNLAGNQWLLGRFQEYKDLNKRILDIYLKNYHPRHPAVATSLNQLGMFYLNMSDYHLADSLLHESLAINEQEYGPDHLAVSANLLNLGALYLNQDLYGKAASVVHRALVIKEKVYGSEHPKLVPSLNNLGGIYTAQERYDEAEHFYQRVLAINEKFYGPQHTEVSQILRNLGWLYTMQGRYGEAEPLYKRVNSNYLSIVRNIFMALSEYERKQYYKTFKVEFEGFNLFAVKRKNTNPSIVTEMYNNQLATKALLLNSVDKVKRIILGSGNLELISLYLKWLDQKQLLAKLFTLSKEEITKWGFNLDSLKNATNNLEKQLSNQSEVFAQAADTTLYTWRDVKGQLKSSEAAIEIARFATIDTVFYAVLIITSDTLDYPELVLLENGKDLEAKHFWEYQKCRTEKRGLAYQQYWQPIKEILKGIKKVYFSPDGIYNQMNLNILFNAQTGEYLLDEIDLHLVTNTKDLLQFGEQQSDRGQALLFGRPKYKLDSLEHLDAIKEFTDKVVLTLVSDHELQTRKRTGYNDLPFTEMEVKRIDSVLNKNGWSTTVYLGKEALEEEVKAVDNPKVLHIATHGFFLQNRPNNSFKGRGNIPTKINENNLHSVTGVDPMLRSGLILAGAASYPDLENKFELEDGILTAYEASSLDLDSTELVVLSACETGLGEVEYGEGVYGLQRAFKVAGAKTILMSLWKVDDTATQKLMTSFYEEWLATGNKRQAFIRAQRKIRDKYPDPEYWGAFIMVGE